MRVRLCVAACVLLIGLLPLASGASPWPALIRPALGEGQQERPGVPQPAGEPNFTVTRHGDILFEANVAAASAGAASRVMLTETIEISGVKNAQDWIEFIHAFAGATARASLDAIPASASKKKGKVIAVFALHRDGGVEGAVSLVRSSGDPSIDDATRLAIAKSAPFPALPQDFPDAVARFRVTFAYNHPHPLLSQAGASQ
ncbi:MAG: energy transducer TonB [Candidatus Acidiferrales bacterium]